MKIVCFTKTKAKSVFSWSSLGYPTSWFTSKSFVLALFTFFCVSTLWEAPCGVFNLIERTPPPRGVTFTPNKITIQFGPPYYCTPLVCVPAVIGVLTVLRHYKPKTKKNHWVPHTPLSDVLNCPEVDFLVSSVSSQPGRFTYDSLGLLHALSLFVCLFSCNHHSRITSLPHSYMVLITLHLPHNTSKSTRMHI